MDPRQFIEASQALDKRKDVILVVNYWVISVYVECDFKCEIHKITCENLVEVVHRGCMPFVWICLTSPA